MNTFLAILAAIVLLIACWLLFVRWILARADAVDRTEDLAQSDMDIAQIMAASRPAPLCRVLDMHGREVR